MIKQMTIKHAEHQARELNARYPHKGASYKALPKPDGSFKVEIQRTEFVPGRPIQCGESANGVCIHEKPTGGMTIPEFVTRYHETKTRRGLLEAELTEARKAHQGASLLHGDTQTIQDRIVTLEAELRALPRTL